jgi:hypothetical protein
VTGTVDTTVVGSYTLSYTATNFFKTATVTRTVNVIDTIAPLVTIIGGAEVTLEAGTSWNDPGASASDTRAGDLTGAIQVGGSVDANVVGSYTLTYTVSDGFNTGSATRTVRIEDTTAPSMSNLTVTPSTIAVPNHKMVDVALTYTASDLTGTPVCSVSITSNEPIDGPGDGNSTVDWQVLDTRKVRVRAERSGIGTGRIYTITVTCADASGNATVKTAAVTVPN